MVPLGNIKINKEDVIRELLNFDKEYPTTNDYEEWLDDKTYKYVLEHNNNLYPPKYILSKISGIATPEFSGGYSTNHIFENLGFTIRNKHFWVIPPYESKNMKIFDAAWNYDLKNGTIAVGWGELGNIAGLTYEQYKEHYKESYKAQIKNINWHSKDLNSFWEFWNEIEEGSTVIARKGRKKLIGIGKITKLAFYDETKGRERVNNLTDAFYANFLGVDWKDITINYSENRFIRNTIDKINVKEYLDIIKDLNKKKLVDETSKVDTISLLEKKKQIILYGPPGTGKTYQTKKIAINFLKG